MMETRLNMENRLDEFLFDISHDLECARIKWYEMERSTPEPECDCGYDAAVDELVTLRAENEALRQRVSDLISDSNGREIDLNKMRHRVEDLENRNAALQLIVDELALCGVENLTPRYRVVQVDHDLWNAAQEQMTDAARATLRGKGK